MKPIGPYSDARVCPFLTSGWRIPQPDIMIVVIVVSRESSYLRWLGYQLNQIFPGIPQRTR